MEYLNTNDESIPKGNNQLCEMLIRMNPQEKLRNRKRKGGIEGNN
jgi:hypothetical protein